MEIGYKARLTMTSVEDKPNMKVTFKRNYMEYPTAYLNNLSPGVYLVNEDDDIIVVSKSVPRKTAISLKTLYEYKENDFFSKVRPIGKGNEVIITGE